MNQTGRVKSRILSFQSITVIAPTSDTASLGVRLHRVKNHWYKQKLKLNSKYNTGIKNAPVMGNAGIATL